MYVELFIAAGLLNLGQILFALFFAITALLSRYAGRAAAPAWVFGGMALGLGVHAWWTRKNGIGFLDPEPWARCRAPRGWAR